MIKALVGYILDWLFGRIVEAYRVYKAQKAADEGIDSETAKEADQLKKSVTDDEDERAAKDILSRK